MSRSETIRGGAAVGYLTELDQVQAGAVRALRLWADGSDSRMVLRSEFEAQLGSASALHALESFDDMYQLCARFGRRPLMRHGVNCRCLGGDEAGFANFIAVAAEGDREEAMWIATTLVRADAAPVLVDLAQTFALYLSQLASPVFATAPVTHQAAPRLH